MAEDVEVEPPATVEVMARANLTLQGRLIVVGEVVTLDFNEEIRACINQELLALRADDTGAFPDLGPPPKARCCS